MADDSSVAAEWVALQLEETFAASDDAATGSTSDEGSALAASEMLLTAEQSCEPEATGGVRLVGLREGTQTKSTADGQWDALLHDERTVHLSSDTGRGVACRSNGQQPQLQWRLFTALSMNVDANRKREKTLKNQDGQLIKQKKIEALVKRQVSWKRGVTLSYLDSNWAATRTDFVGTQSMALKMFGLQKGWQESETLTSSTTEAPFTVTTAWVSPGRAVRALSGQVTTQQGDGGSRLVTTYQNLLFDSGSSTPCAPVAGRIEGALWAPGATTAQDSYFVTFDNEGNGVVTFSKSGVTASFDGGGSCKNP